MRAVEIALFPHHVFQKGDLTFVEEQQQLAGFDEIDLRRHQRDRCQPCILIARHGGRRNRQNGAAKAIADGVDRRSGTMASTASSAAMTPRLR